MAEQQLISLSCDDSYLSLLVSSQEHDQEFEPNDETNTPMSDSKYAQQLQFQEALMGSILLSVKTPVSEKGLKIVEEIGESSQVVCDICAERKDNDEMFSVKNCTHRYCTDCISKHIEIKVQKCVNETHAFDCPGVDCEGVLDIDSCRGVVSEFVIGMWDDVLCEALIDSSQKFYCPFTDCSGLILNDGDAVVRESECPFCHRLFCAQCKVAWHSGFGCEEFMRLNENERAREDLMVHELAKKEKWQRCPRCKFFVEKVQGCLHMTCRCGYEFCYACGATWSSNHGGCQPQ